MKKILLSSLVISFIIGCGTGEGISSVTIENEENVNSSSYSSEDYSSSSSSQQCINAPGVIC